MARWPDAGFLTTSDQLGNTTHDDGLETHRGIHSAFNIGYMLFRKSALPLVEEWRTVIRADPSNKWDQGEFNRIARLKWDVGRTSGLSDERLFWAYKSQVIGGVLPLSLFAGGHNHFVSQYARRLGWQPYSIHTTFQYGAAAGKRHGACIGPLGPSMANWHRNRNTRAGRRLHSRGTGISQLRLR